MKVVHLQTKLKNREKKDEENLKRSKRLTSKMCSKLIWVEGMIKSDLQFLFSISFKLYVYVQWFSRHSKAWCKNRHL